MTGASSNIVEIRVVSKDMSAAGFDSARKRARGLAADIDSGPQSAGAAIERADKKAKGLHGTLGSVGQIAGGILAADVLREAAQRVYQLAQTSIHAASSLGESLNAVDKTFGTSADHIHQWAESNAASFGLSQRAFNESATPLGAMLKNQSLAMEDVEFHTIKLTKRAADMASVFNTQVGDALVAIQAGLRGESDPLERYGVSLQAVAVDARALADSGKTTTSMLTQQERALARLNLIYDQTASTQGDFADTATGLANAQRISTARIEDAQAKIGQTFLPVMAAAAQASGNFAQALGGIPSGLVATVAAVALAGAGLLVFAPRIMATKRSLDEMAASESLVTRGVGRFATAIGKAGGALAIMQIGGAILGSVLENDLNPKIDAASKGLEEYAKTSVLAGEASRVFGSDLDELTRGFNKPEKSGFDKFMDGLAPLLGGVKAEVGHGTEALAAFDTALAGLVKEGKGETAFQLLSVAAAKAGLAINEAKQKLPEFSAALEVAGVKVEDLGEEISTTKDRLEAYIKTTEDAIKSTFGLEEATDKAADDVARLTEKVNENAEAGVEGAKSLSGNSQAARDNREAVRGLVEDYQKLIQENYAAGKSTDGLAKELEDQLVAMGFSREEAQRYTQQIAGLGVALQSLPAVTTAEVVVRLTQQETYREGVRQNKYSGGIVGAAGGGPRSGRITAGEYGTEVIDLAPGATVHSNADSMRMMANEARTGWSGYGPNPGGAGGSMGYVEIGSDGSAEGDRMIRILAAAIRGRGGDPSIIGLKIRTSSA